MYETADDLAGLQALLDESYEHAGKHLRDIITPDRRLRAEELVERLRGMCLLSLATVTADGRPLVSPVDGHFYRGRFRFGSAPYSMRFRHIARNPHVSATHLPSEHLAVTVHGTARAFSIEDPEHAQLRGHLRELYGEQWESWGPSAAYAVIEPHRMFTFWMPETPDADAPEVPDAAG